MTRARAQAVAPSVGILLKQWRKLRGHSQLSLALALEISPRHLSFVESGRAQPSRDFLVRLSDGLEIPLRERNVLLAAAGFAPMYPETALEGEAFRPLRAALVTLLEHQEPYPAVLLDREWNVILTNRAAPKLFGHFIDLEALPTPRNLLRTIFQPAGLWRWIENWEAVSQSLFQRVFREAVAGVPDPRVTALLSELGATGHRLPARAGLLTSPNPFEPVIFRRGSLRLGFFSMITTVGAPLDVTAEELRLELFFPADPATEAFARTELASAPEVVRPAP